MKPMAKDERPPILLNKHHRDASVLYILALEFPHGASRYPRQAMPFRHY